MGAPPTDSNSSLKPDISPRVHALRDRLITVRRDLHRHPEPAFGEVRTARLVAERLEELGWTVRTGVAKTGVIADRENGTGKVLLLRFDMDALPVSEATGAPYASTVPGWMHACGHDGHTSIGLAMAELLAGEVLSGAIRLVFQPAEESGGGAKPMVEEGALEKPRVDACLGLHLRTEMPIGRVSAAPGPVMASTDLFHITVHGRGGHGATPQHTCDALVVAAHLVTALQTIVSRQVDPLEDAVVTVGMIQAGTAHNIIAEEARLTGTFRTFKPTVQTAVMESMKRICEGIGFAFGARVELEIEHGYPAVVNDPSMAAMVQAAAEQVVGAGGAQPEPPWMAGEDMSYYLRERPGCFFFVGAGNAERGFVHPHHSPHFDFDEDALLVGCEVLLRAARSFLSTPNGTPPTPV